MALVPDQKFSTFQNGGTPMAGDIIVGLRAGINTRFNWAFPTAVDSLTGTANQVLVDGTSGTPLTGAITLSAPQDIAPSSSPTFTAVHTGAILDSSGNNVLTFLSDPSSVNWIEVASATTGASPAFTAKGSDTNVSITNITKGTGQNIFSSANTTTPIVVFSGTGFQHQTNFNFANTSATRTVTYQDATGTLAFLSDIPAGGMTWSTVTISTTTSVFNGYVSNSAGALTFTLPATASVGDVVAVEGLGAGGWILTANTGQTIKIGSGTTSSAGSLSSAAASDNVYVTCIVANTTWRVRTTNSAGLIIS